MSCSSNNVFTIASVTQIVLFCPQLLKNFHKKGVIREYEMNYNILTINGMNSIFF